jgi:hypothetical protein
VSGTPGITPGFAPCAPADRGCTPLVIFCECKSRSVDVISGESAVRTGPAPHDERMAPASVSLATPRSVSVPDRGSRRRGVVVGDRRGTCVVGAVVGGRVVMLSGVGSMVSCGRAGDSAAVHPFATQAVAWSRSASASGLNQMFGRATW